MRWRKHHHLSNRRGNMELNAQRVVHPLVKYLTLYHLQSGVSVNKVDKAFRKGQYRRSALTDRLRMPSAQISSSGLF